jgi:CcmD family protein
VGYLVAAYAVFWALTFLYIFSISRRQKGLEQEIQALKQILEEERP